MSTRITRSIVKPLIFIVVLECLIVKTQTQECCEDYCYDLDKTLPFRPQYRHLGQRNSYDFLKGSDYQIYNMPGDKNESTFETETKKKN